MNYFIINSDKLQLFDVEEAMSTYSLKREETVIIVRKSIGHGTKISLKLESDIKSFYNWQKFDFIVTPKFIRVLKKFFPFLFYILDTVHYRNQVLTSINKYGKPSRLFFGNYKNDGMKDVANRYSDKVEVFFMDEGNTTIGYLHQREQYFKNDLKVKKSLSYKIKKFIFNLKIDHPHEMVTFFTVYEGTSNDYTTIQKHTYENNRKKLLGKTIFTEDSIFIGSILVEFEIIKRETYILLLEWIIKNHGKFTYFAHPKEQDRDLNIYASELGIDIKKLDVPLELHFIDQEILAKNILTFQSSAIFNLSKIYGNNLSYKVLRIPEEIFDTEKHKKEFRLLYDNFEKNKQLEVVPVDLIVENIGKNAKN